MVRDEEGWKGGLMEESIVSLSFFQSVFHVHFPSKALFYRQS